MKTSLSPRTIALITADTLTLYCGVLLALILRNDLDGAAFQLNENNGWTKIALVTLVCLTNLYIYDLYNYIVISNRRELRSRMIQAIGTSWVLLAVLYYFLPSYEIGRGTAIYSIIVTLVLLFGLRSGIHFVLGHPKIGEKILIVGDTQVVIDTAKAAIQRRDAGYRIAGYVTNEIANVEKAVAGPRNLGRIDDLEKIVEREKINSIVIGVREQRGAFPTAALLRLRLAGEVTIEEFTSFFERVTGRVYLDMLRPSWLIFSRRTRDTQWMIASRELAYRFLALTGFVVSLPIALITAILIKLESTGPCLYRQERVGKNGHIFELLKFRSMNVDAEQDGTAVWAKLSDDRATQVGKVIRKIRVDEIPQFWNILKGDMSFIGPRPERPQFVSTLAAEIPFYEHRHLVAPGLTGWAQIKYPYGASIEDAKHKLEYDLYYIKNQSFALDVIILLETVKTIMFGRGGR